MTSANCSVPAAAKDAVELLADIGVDRQRGEPKRPCAGWAAGHRTGFRRGNPQHHARPARYRQFRALSFGPTPDRTATTDKHFGG
jgi:hypothetical protein